MLAAQIVTPEQISGLNDNDLEALEAALVGEILHSNEIKRILQARAAEFTAQLKARREGLK